jgi:type IV pilus assembly protein PilF
MKHVRWVLFVTGTLMLCGCVSTGGQQSTLRKSESSEAEKAGELNKQLGSVYLRQGNLALAKEKLERAEKYNSRDPELHSVLALLYERLNIPEEVDKHYRTAIRLAPKDPEISNNYAVYLCQHGRTDEGVKRFLESARNPLYRTPEMAYTNAGVCLRRAKRLDEAANSFQRALAIRPRNAEAVFQAADLALERGDAAKGREQVDKYLASFDATADVLEVGVRLARAQGDRVAEEKYTRRLRVEFPSSPQFRSLNEPAAKRNPG